MLGRVLEILAVLAVSVFIIWEIIVPALTGKKLFPWLNKQRNTVKQDAREFNQRVADERLREVLESAKRKEAATKARREAKFNKKEQ